MKRNFTFLIAALALIFCLASNMVAWGQTTVTQTSFSAISGNVNNDTKVSYAAYKGGGTSNPAVNSNAIRLYQNSNGQTGGYVVIGVAEGYVITSATIRSSMATTTGYKLTETDPGSTTPAKNTFNVSNYSLSANTDYTVNSLSTRYIVFACFGTSSSSRLYLSKISITYQASGSTGGTEHNITINSMLNGTVQSSHETASEGTTITLTPQPATNYAFGSMDVIGQSSTSYQLTNNNNGTWSFTMPDEDVYVNAGFIPASTVTITVPQDFNTDINQGTNAGTLTASVTETGSGNAISGATVTWASSNTDVATVNNGVVTLVGVGTTDITASYAGDQYHAAAVGTYQLTVINGAYVTYDFTSVSNFWINNTYTTHPTAGTSGSHTDLRTFYYDNETHDEFTGTGTIYFQTNYLMMNSASTLTLPTYQGYKITQIIITNTSSCSTAVEVGILSGGNNAATAQTWGTQSGSYTYNISSDYQTEALTVKVTNSKNAQVAGITVVREEINSNKVATPTFEPAGGVITESTDVTISCDTDEATIYYTTDGSTPTTSSAVYSQAITVNSTMTLKAIAVKSGMADSNVGEAAFTRKYFVNLTQATGGTISVNPAQAEVGQTVTLTASSNVGYTFGSWTVTPSVTVSGNTFTMPANDVTVSATFIASTDGRTVSFSINDKVEMTATVFNGGSIDLTKFVADVATEGYTFKGWSESANGAVVSSPYEPSADITLYAQFEEDAPVVPGDYTLVTDASQLVAGNLVVIAASAYDEAMSTEQKTNNRGQWEIEKSNGNANISWTDGTQYTVCEFVLGGSSTGWSFYEENKGYIYAAGTKTSGTNYLKTRASATSNGNETDNWGLWTVVIGNNSKATIRSVGNTNTPYLKYNTGGMFACYNTDSQSDVVLYTKPAAKSAKGNRADVEATSKVTAIASNVIVTVKANGIVYLTGSNAGNEANLIVEDGGQLVASNDVKGTMQKTIIGYSSSNPGWYFISSPLTTTKVSQVQNLVDGTYDLYYFDQNPEIVDGIGLEWINYKATHFSSLYVGSGYLYANADPTTTLGFAGMLRKNMEDQDFMEYGKNIAYQEQGEGGDINMAGWNLVGNPFPSNAKVDRGFYKMNNTSDGINPTVVSANSVIGPMEGVFVLATENEQNPKVTFTATTDSPTAKSRGININVARQGEMLDNAIVSLNAGSSLCKLILSDNTTKLYFRQGQKDYAIVASPSENEVPVSFKASRNGSYTLTVNAEDLEMNYLHLIDNMTGNDVDLLVNPSYTFDASTRDYESRFRLVFAANNEDNASSSETFAFYSNGNWIVNNNAEAVLQLIDLTGRVISSETINGTVAKAINATPGVYMLRLVNNNEVKTQKILVK